MRILHIDTGLEWRGGQQQVAFLLSGLHCTGYGTALVCKPDSQLFNHVRSRGIPSYTLPLIGQYDLHSVSKIARLCRHGTFDIVHAHTSHAHGLGLWVKLLFPKVKLVVTRRVNFPISTNWLNLYKYRKADTIICISSAIRRTLRHAGLPPQNLPVVYSGVDPSRFMDIHRNDLSRHYNIAPYQFVVGTIASFRVEKDYGTFVRAAEIVLAQRSDVTFIGLGDGPERRQMIKHARKMNLEGKIHFPGFQKELGPFLSRFDLYVASSRHEGLGTSILDAMSLGIPVVASNTGGIPEIVNPGESGMLFPPGNAEQLAKAILYLMGDDQLRQEIGKNARQVAAKLNVNRMVEGNIYVYHSLLK
ncbi:MAG: glycosyltransferase [Candidatus Marinimicrobia bacterium]|nr:glycosyltransferase [Candidatus Neomarinimicrobiota bacterium]